MKNKKLIFWAIASSLAGFLFGFDTVVISGADKQIQELWNLSGSMHGWALSAALWGTVLGSLIGGFPTERIGRKKTLISIGLLYLLSALGSAFATDVYVFMLSRFIGGLGVGISTVAAPLFIAEISPAKDRGKLAGLFQFNIVFGILIAYFSNYIIASVFPENIAWRWMLGIEAIPALIYFVMTFVLPESPRWLITYAKKRSEGVKIFQMINPDMKDEEIEHLANEVEQSTGNKEKRTPFWTKKFILPISLAFVIAMFNQLSGINVILYFAPRLLGLAGVEDAMASSVSLGVTNLIFTFIGLWLIDKLGRKTLLYIGSIGYIISLGICAVAFLSVSELGAATGTNISGAISWVVLICIIVFIAAHALGQGAVIWVFISEIFPNEQRASGQALGSFTHWFFAALLTLLFPLAIKTINAGYLFAFFALMMVLQLIWVKTLVPETKGKRLEEISKLIKTNKDQ